MGEPKKAERSSPRIAQRSQISVGVFLVCGKRAGGGRGMGLGS